MGQGGGWEPHLVNFLENRWRRVMDQRGEVAENPIYKMLRKTLGWGGWVGNLLVKFS